MNSGSRPSAARPGVRLALGAALFVSAGLLAAGCGTKNPTAPVVFPPLSRVVIALGSDTLFVADTLQVGGALALTAQVRDTGNALVATPAPTWSSTNTGVASVTGNGVVTAMGEGAAWIVLSADTKRDSVALLVLPAANGWLQQVSNSSRKLNGVYFDSDGRRGWAVGDGGEILATTTAGVTWTRQTSNTAFNLNGVWFTSASEGWVAGHGGTVLHTLNGGGTWTRLTTNASENLFGVRFATRDTGWAVGSSGAILRTFDRGVTWAKQNPTAFALRGVSFSDTRNGWAVGDNGTILGTVDRGLTWTVVTPGITTQSLRAVWRRGPLTAWAGGAQGVAPRTVDDGFGAPQWELRNAGAASDLDGVAFASDLTGWACGTNGTGIVLRTDDGGVTWLPQVVPNGTPLNDVFFVDDLRGWAVGDNGRILHTGSGGNP